MKNYLEEGGFPGALREGASGPVLLRELLRDVVQPTSSRVMPCATRAI